MFLGRGSLVYSCFARHTETQLKKFMSDRIIMSVTLVSMMFTYLLLLTASAGVMIIHQDL